jgi:hypothetical protein
MAFAISSDFFYQSEPRAKADLLMPFLSGAPLWSVSRQGLRPSLPPWFPPLLRNLLRSCWHPSPDRRPDFPTVVRILEALRQAPPSHGSPAVPVRRGPASFRLLASCFSGGGAAGPPGGDGSATSSDSSPSAPRGEAFFKLRPRRQQG